MNQNLNYATLLKIMVEISHNVNRAQTVFHSSHITHNKLLAIHDTSHFSKGNAAMCHGANKIQKKKLETSGFRKPEFRKLDRETSEFRKIQNSESGNWMLLGTL